MVTDGENRLRLANRITPSAARTFLHRGIASRDFEQRFQLADHIKAANANMENGSLGIELVHEIPEALKPRKIEIGVNNGNQFVAAHRTSRTCPRCDHASKDNRLTQAAFLCVECGYEHHANVVGALNILARGYRVLAGGEPAPPGRSVKQGPAQGAT